MIGPLSRCATFFALIALASAEVRGDENASDVAPEPQALASVRHLLEANQRIAGHRPDRFFDAFKTGQQPTATVVACSDLRVQMSDFAIVPDEDLFVLRDIGNQVDTARGSVEYGVRHLKTPLLLIVGHVSCGAVKAALDDYFTNALGKGRGRLVVVDINGERDKSKIDAALAPPSDEPRRTK